MWPRALIHWRVFLECGCGDTSGVGESGELISFAFLAEGMDVVDG